jgi:hypothetical protein
MSTSSAISKPYVPAELSTEHCRLTQGGVVLLKPSSCSSKQLAGQTSSNSNSWSYPEKHIVSAQEPWKDASARGDNRFSGISYEAIPNGEGAGVRYLPSILPSAVLVSWFKRLKSNAKMLILPMISAPSGFYANCCGTLEG